MQSGLWRFPHHRYPNLISTPLFVKFLGRRRVAYRCKSETPLRPIDRQNGSYTRNFLVSVRRRNEKRDSLGNPAPIRIPMGVLLNFEADRDVNIYPFGRWPFTSSDLMRCTRQRVWESSRAAGNSSVSGVFPSVEFGRHHWFPLNPTYPRYDLSALYVGTSRFDLSHPLISIVASLRVPAIGDGGT